jgi:hypothetical protein
MLERDAATTACVILEPTVQGAAIEIVLTNGLDSVKIELPTAKLIPESPSIESAGAEIRLPETWMATTGTSTPGWKVTVTNTP